MLSDIGSVASIIGGFIALYTLNEVNKVKKQLWLVSFAAKYEKQFKEVSLELAPIIEALSSDTSKLRMHDKVQRIFKTIDAPLESLAQNVPASSKTIKKDIKALRKFISNYPCPTGGEALGHYKTSQNALLSICNFLPDLVKQH